MPLVSTMLSKDEHAALQKAPGLSDKQRMRWLVKFFQATLEEKQMRDIRAKEAAAEAARAKLHVAGDIDVREPAPFRGKVSMEPGDGAKFAQPVVIR